MVNPPFLLTKPKIENIFTLKTDESRSRNHGVYPLLDAPQTRPALKNVTQLKKLCISQGVRIERVMGIEPTLSAWEAEVLPLNYTRIVSNIQSGIPVLS